MTIWCERPTPSVKRPPAMACAESACCAIACGWRGKVGITAVPSSMRRVSRAQSAAAMIASIPMMLANQPLAKPSASARLACATSPSTPAEGQRAILAGYGIAEDAIGAPIRSSMETVHLGTTDDGIPLHFDRAAHEADHVAIVNRVKPHTNFSGEIESGLLKMTMIGLGKHTGAALCHRAIVDHSFDRVARSAGRALLARCRIAFGLALVENGYDETALVEAVPATAFTERDRPLLVPARPRPPRLPALRPDLPTAAH